MSQPNSSTAAKIEVVLTRVFDAPRELVWRAWTDPKQLAQWWGPHEFTTPVCEIDVRPGGAIVIHVQGPDGMVFTMNGAFEEVVPPERLVFRASAFDGVGDFLIEGLATVTFAEQSGRTTLTVQDVVTKMAAGGDGTAEGMEEGWSQSFDKLAAHLNEGEAAMPSKSGITVILPSDREIEMARVFDAPRDLIWKVITDPAQVPNWWGPRRYTTVVDTMDVRPGGVWRFIHRGEGGAEYGFNGEYREIVPPEKIVQTFEFEGMPGHIAVETMTLEEHDGKTTLRVNSRYSSVEDRDGVLQSGMEGGAAETYDRLAELLATLA